MKLDKRSIRKLTSSFFSDITSRSFGSSSPMQLPIFPFSVVMSFPSILYECFFLKKARQILPSQHQRMKRASTFFSETLLKFIYFTLFNRYMSLSKTGNTKILLNAQNTTNSGHKRPGDSSLQGSHYLLPVFLTISVAPSTSIYNPCIVREPYLHIVCNFPNLPDTLEDFLVN